MKNNNYRPRARFVIGLSLLLLGAFATSFAQTGNISQSEWKHLSVADQKRGAERAVAPTKGEMLLLDNTLLRQKLGAIPTVDPAAAKTRGTIISIPKPDGGMAQFSVVEAPVMEAALAAQFPEIKTYAGQGIDDSLATVRLDLNALGFHAQVLSPNGAYYVDPAYRFDTNYHVSYYKHDLLRPSGEFQCGITNQSSYQPSPSSTATANKIQSATTLRTYRLALACTGEYAAYFGGTASAAASAMVTAVNRVDGIYETELAARIILIGNDNLLIYTNASTDPYSNASGSAMLTQNQTTIDSIIGSANYDFGHVFSTGGGGVAYLGSLCNASDKAGGVTGNPAPNGDAFWVDYVAHEMGHQFGADHTFNSGTGSCGGGNRNASTAYEPGSGSTIMAYAGICSPNDLQPHSDPYFHGVSLDEIQAHLSSGGTCSVNSATGNSAPTISAGASYTIPASTPFVLTATGNDVNGDTLSYCWEEFDLGASTALTDADNGSSPLFRSFNPTNVPYRYFPKFSSVLAHTNWNQEILPSLARTMNFRVTARDNRTGGGGVADATTTVVVAGGTGPFVVTSPNTAVTLSGTTAITWNVAGTSASPINATGVNILLSTDGGLTFPTLLASNAPNTGSANVTLPSITSSTARIMIQGAGNIFYDISDVNFNITLTVTAPNPQIASATLISESCTPTNGLIDPYETVTIRLGVKNFGTIATTNLVVTLLTNNGVYYASAAKAYGAIPANGTVSNTFTFTPAAACGSTVAAVFQFKDGAGPATLQTNLFSIGATSGITDTNNFANTALITIPTVGNSTPYPSTILVSGVTNPIVGVTATLNGFAHLYPDDVGVLLVGPGGQNVVLMDATGGGTSVSGLTLAFSDSASSSLSGAALTSGTYKPSNLYASDAYPAPAPTIGPYGSSLSALAATPNGTWSLYVEDFSTGDDGSITGGWSLSFTTSNAVPVCCTTYLAPSFTSTTYSNKTVQLKWSTLPGPHYQVQYRTNLTLGSWQNLGAPALGTSTTLTASDFMTNSPIRFYRVVVGP